MGFFCYIKKCSNLTQSGSLSSLAFRSCAFPSLVNWLSSRLEVKKEITVRLQMLTILINVNMEKDNTILTRTYAPFDYKPPLTFWQIMLRRYIYL